MEISKRKRFSPDERKNEILLVAVGLAVGSNYATITRGDVARLSNCSPQLVNHYFNTMDNLRTEIIKYAVTHRINDIVIQAIVNHDQHASTVSDDVLIRAGRDLIKQIRR